MRRMSSERARQKRLERKRRRREERRRSSRSRFEDVPLSLGRPMSEILPRFADPWLERLPDDGDEDAMKHVLELAAVVWNAAVVGEDVEAAALDIGRRLFAALGWPEDVEEEIRTLRERKAVLFPAERRLFLGVEVAREPTGLRVYAMSAVV